MSTDLLFELDTSGDSTRNSSRMFYTTIGNLEITEDELSSKPSQERPAILKTKSKRYHQQDDKKKFIPGKLSSSLRQALGLRRYDIPEHIYRMRHLGYPPGWLRQAEVKSEGITIFGANNNVVNPNQNNTNVKYDWEMLHEYPGFNSYNSYDYRYDYCTEKGFMSMQQDCLLENFKNFLQRSQMLGKEATDITQIRSSQSVRNGSTDFNLPSEGTGKRKPMACSTPYKPEPKRAKMNLSVVELSDGELVDDDNEEIEEISMECSSDEYDEEPRVSQRQSSFNLVTEEGTMLIVPSVLNKPSLDRFSEGINEHRLFENLPNSGGTYRKVRDVLKKVRC